MGEGRLACRHNAVGHMRDKNRRVDRRNGLRKSFRAVAASAPYVKPWYAPVNAITPVAAGLQHCRLSAILDRLGTGVGENNPGRRSPPVVRHRPNVSAQSSRASRSFNSFGCTSPMAWRSSPGLAANGATTRGLVSRFRPQRRMRPSGQVLICRPRPHVRSCRRCQIDRPDASLRR